MGSEGWKVAMRKVILNLGLSLDGHIARSSGAVDFLFRPKDYSMEDFFASVDTALMGRKTLDAALRLSGGSIPSTSMEMYVFSRSQPAGKRDGLIFTRQSPASLVSKLRKHSGKDIWLMGGGELARDFLQADLVDEIHLGIVPVLLGAGIPLFPGGHPQREFKLLESRSYSKGLVTVKYSRDRESAKPRKQTTAAPE
jgi:dihydrofolate reductase